MPFQNYKIIIIPIFSNCPWWALTLCSISETFCYIQLYCWMYKLYWRQHYVISILITFEIIIVQEYIFLRAAAIFIVTGGGGGISFEFDLHNIIIKFISWLLPLRSANDNLQFASQILAVGKSHYTKSWDRFNYVWRMPQLQGL
jgi:hypothetical protein